MIGNKKSLQQQIIDGLFRRGAHELRKESKPKTRFFGLPNKRGILSVTKDGTVLFYGKKVPNQYKNELILLGQSKGQKLWEESKNSQTKSSKKCTRSRRR